MEGVKTYKDLIVWQKAISLVVEIYNLTVNFPSEEKFGIISQMKRSAISIPSNISEGQKRRTRRDFCHFLYIAYGSGAELETQIEISKRIFINLNLDYSKADSLLDEVMKMLNRLINTLNK